MTPSSEVDSVEFPKSEFYDLADPLTQLGTGEAAVSILSESGAPTPVVHTKMRAPESRMAPADDVDGAAKASHLYATYGTRTESQSAREMLAPHGEAIDERRRSEGAERAHRGGNRDRRRGGGDRKVPEVQAGPTARA
jgi:Helicase HerA-like C-terminal